MEVNGCFVSAVDTVTLNLLKKKNGQYKPVLNVHTHLVFQKDWFLKDSWEEWGGREWMKTGYTVEGYDDTQLMAMIL